jgi:transcriptional regulator with XRE-family HTH domain
MIHYPLHGGTVVSPEEHSIGRRLRALREAAELSQQELAFRSRVSMSVISRIEQGRKTGLDPRLSTLTALARGLEMPVEQFIAALLRDKPARGRKDKE